MRRAVRREVRGVAVLSAATLAVFGLCCVIGRFIVLAGAFGSARNYGGLIEVSILYGIICLLMYSIVVFCLAEYGYVRRGMSPAAPPRPEEAIDAGEDRKALLVLVPSYKEEEDVIRQTLISAALVEYPGRRVVLLIDDPPAPATVADAEILAASRRLPDELRALLAAPARHLGSELSAHLDRARRSEMDLGAEAARLARLYEWAADWLGGLARDFAEGRPEPSHTDRLFIDRILLAPARAHRERAGELRRVPVSADGVGREYRRLAALFRAEFGSFERKRYANLSHAPNKAMNLNSYLALVGGSFREVDRRDGLHLEACDDGRATLRVPTADYVATLDADSLMTWDYATRLVPAMERPGNERVAIAQTPYTAMPDPPAPLERAASASTDAQFFNHQGMAHLGACFWVGATALMRRAALDDIATWREERGHRVRVYIDDRILIEDAAATVDLLGKGWRVHHDRGRLSYSATPADFGALLIQRRRWANGGLLILPRLLRHASRRPWSLAKLADAVVRIPNLMAAGLAGIGLPVLLLYRFDDGLVPLWMPLLAVPYYLLYGGDLRLAGYRWADLPRVYALNVLLIPVNLGGTLQSLRQAFTGRPIPFQRTPKVSGRTRTPAIYLVGIYGFCAYALVCAAFDGLAGRWTHMLYGLLNGAAAAYGIVAFVGLAASRDDVLARIASRRPSTGRRERARGLSTLVPTRNRS